MNTIGTLQIVLFFIAILLITKPLGGYMALVYEGERTLLHPLLGWLEKALYRVCGIEEDEDMKWTSYEIAMLVFSAAGMLLTYAMLRLQGTLPLNPQHFDAKQIPAHLAFNTSASFTTNTNWQSYIPEQTVSYLSNMVALALHNWASAAVGMAVAVAMIRGFSRKSANGIGNLWADVVRGTVYVLLPISFIAAIAYLASGCPQNFHAYTQATTLEGAKQLIAQGPVASQEAIKILGTNGGGFFNANSAHPYENPTGFTNFLTVLLIFTISTGLTATFGKMVGNARQGWAIFAAMSVMFLAGAIVCNSAEQGGTPQLSAAHIETARTYGQPGGNMEGKEVRFGIGSSTLFAVVTTDASCGAVNSMHDSYTPLGGLVPLSNILTGEVIFGGVGAGLFGILMFAIIGVFIAGLMVGRTPEYLGKKIGKFEVQMAMLATLVLGASVLGFTALSATMKYPTNSKSPYADCNYYAGSSYGGANTYYGPTSGNINNTGSHGLSEILYAYASGTGNNGSAFAGITANTPHYDTTIGFAMLLGRFFMIIPLLAIAGSLAQKKRVPVTAGTFPTDGGTFVALLVGVVIIVNALTYFPALSLGPIVEHFQMQHMKTQ